MSVFAEFHIPTDEFALQRTFERAPETVIEIERVAAATDVLTPYFWVSGGDLEDFRTAAAADPSIEDLTELDTFEEMALYRAHWTENVASIVYAYTQIGAVILEATGSADVWELEMRFDTDDRLREFQTYCVENDVPFDLQRVHDLAQPVTGSQYDLTEKQRDALVAAWEAGYFDSPRRASLDEVAAELGISQQALSDRIRRACQSLIANTLTVTPPEEA